MDEKQRLEKETMETLVANIPQGGQYNVSEGVIAAGQVTALLDHGSSFEGQLTFEGTARIGGDFKGEIFTRDTLVVNPGARIEAQIEAENVIISGVVIGHIFAKRQVVMHPPAVFVGTVTTPSLRIDEGVRFEGASYMPSPVGHSPSEGQSGGVGVLGSGKNVKTTEV